MSFDAVTCKKDGTTFWWLLLAVLAWAGPALALADDTCFDFSAGPPIRDLSAGRNADSGTKASGVVWAREERVLGRPVVEIYRELLNHERTRSREISKMVIETVPVQKFSSFQEVSFEVNPFPLITVGWKEQWAFEIAAGDAATPEKIRVGYQKTSGTSHIRHLCGFYLLTRRGPEATQVLVYEEVLATRRSLEDTRKGIAATLDRLGRK